MHARDVLPFRMRVGEQRDDGVEVEFGRIDDLLRAMAVEHGGRHQRSAYRITRHVRTRRWPFTVISSGSPGPRR